MNTTNWLRKAVYTDGFKIVEKIYSILCCEINATESYLYICTPSGIIQLHVICSHASARECSTIHTRKYTPADGYGLGTAANTLGFLHTLCEITSIPYEAIEITCILSTQSRNLQCASACGLNECALPANKLIHLACPVLRNSWNCVYLESFAAAKTDNQYSAPTSVIGFDLTGFISKWDLKGNLTDIYNYIPETIGCIKTDDLYLYVADSCGMLQVYNVLTGSLVSELLLDAEIISIAVVNALPNNAVYVYLLCIDGIIVKLSRETWKCVSNCKRSIKTDYFRSKKMIAVGADLYLIGEFDYIERINFDKMSRDPINFEEFDFTKDEFVAITADKSGAFIAAGTKCGYLYIFEVNSMNLGTSKHHYIRYYCGTYGSKIANITFASDHFYVAFCNGFIARYDADLLRLASYSQQSLVVKKYMMWICLVLRAQGLPKDIIGEIMLYL